MSVYAKPYEARDGSEITQYEGFALEFREASHRYWIHQGEERTAAVSVTSALKILDKPALISWAERCGAEGALTLARAGELDDCAVEDAVDRVRLAKLGADAKREVGADRGTAVHEVLRAYCEDGTVPNVGDFPQEVRGYVSAACRWLLTIDPTPILSEVIIGSPTHGYAGRVDLIAESPHGAMLIDFKTNPAGRVYDEAHVQVAGYLGALPECGIMDVNGAIIVALGAEGEFEEVGCEAMHSDFLSVLDTCRRMGKLRAGRQARERAAKAAAA